MTGRDGGAGPVPGPAPAAASATGETPGPAGVGGEAPGSTGEAGEAGELWLIRHGETEWSRANRHTGHTDLPLTARGEEQARGLARVLAGFRPALVVTSPRQRARRTAELAGLPQAIVEADLAEWDYGEYEGRTSDEIRRDRPEWTIWTGDPPGGESADAVLARADRVLARLRDALRDGPVAVVGHGHFGRVLAARWIGLTLSAGQHFVLDPASPCVLGAEHGVPAIRRWNIPNPANFGLP